MNALYKRLPKANIFVLIYKNFFLYISARIFSVDQRLRYLVYLQTKLGVEQQPYS